jgi:cytoskeletal protein RodZ
MLKAMRGQSLLEYAILMVIIIAALLTLQVYIKRGIQGRLKSSTDDIGDQYSMSEAANYYKVVKTNSHTNDIVNAGVSETKMIGNSVTQTNITMKTNTTGETW